MKFAGLGAVLLLGAMSLNAASSANAASPITSAFLANVNRNVDFLHQSSELATVHARSGAFQAYARGEAVESVKTAEALSSIGAARPTMVAQVEPADTGALMTGRSVAIDAAKGVPGQAANGRAPLGAQDVAALGKLSGKAFDDAFWLKQVDALCQLRADYQAYLDDGDDASLVALAKRELPAVERRLAVLAKI